MAKAIADVGIGELLRQLVYKAEWHGKTIVPVGRWFPSTKRCFHCRKLHDMPLHKREMICSCGHRMDRDVNAAKNIEEEGLRLYDVFACKNQHSVTNESAEYCQIKLLAEANAIGVGSSAG